jgi:predicted RNase H-like HicB family nuclease
MASDRKLLAPLKLAKKPWRWFPTTKPSLDKPPLLKQVYSMRYPVMLERVPDEEGLPGYYYAHVPSLGLTTHGHGMEGALEAARDLVTLWIEEKRAHGEPVTDASEAILATVEVA